MKPVLGLSYAFDLLRAMPNLSVHAVVTEPPYGLGEAFCVGCLRRVSDELPFSELISIPPASRRERLLAPHPTLNAQALLRQIVRAALPEGSWSWTQSTAAAVPWLQRGGRCECPWLRAGPAVFSS